jgi:hypothetical protein
MVSWFGPQNHASLGLSVVPQNRWEGDDVGHALRSSSLLRVEANLLKVFQSSLKTGGGAPVGGACATIVKVSS